MELIDSHVHLDWFPPYALDAIVERAAAAGVTTLLTVGSSLDSSRSAAEIARRYSGVLAAVGVHPAHQVGEITEAEIEPLRQLAGEPSVVAIGEIGLDSVAARVPLEVQGRAFGAQLRLARELGHAVALHVRGADREALEIFDEARLPEGRAVVHYFMGDGQLAAEWIRRGALISLGRPLLRSTELQQLAATLPEDRLLVETDAYPREPGRWAEPADARLVAEKLAGVRGIPLEQLAIALAANFRRFLGG